MKKKRWIAVIMVMILLVSNISIPIAYAQFDDRFDEREFRDPREIVNLGEVIAINVKAYEPAIVPASIIEDDNQVIVYAFLEGYTIGSLLGQDRPSIEPLYGSPAIRSIQISTVNSSRFVRGVRYIRPSSRIVNINDLGTLAIYLARQPRESDVPGSDDFKLFGEGGGRINIELLARVYFSTERLVEFGEQSLLLKAENDESRWRTSNLDDYAYWGKRGYIRVVSIDSTTAVYDVYDGSLRPIAKGRRIRIGQEDGPFGVREYGRELLENRYRIRLDSILEPGIKTAKVKLSVDGETLGYKVLKEGETLYAGSTWSVKSIEQTAIDGKNVDRLILRSRSGDEKEIVKSYQEGTVDPTRNVCEVLAESKYCKAVSAFSNVVQSYSNIKDEDGIEYGQKANYWIGRSYEELSKVAGDVSLANDARRKAIDAYGKVNNYPSAGIAIENSINELNDQLTKNAVGGSGLVTEGNEEFYERNIEIELVGINLDQYTGQKPAAVVEVNGPNARTVDEGSEIVNGWILEDVQDNGIKMRKRGSVIGTRLVDDRVFSSYINEIRKAADTHKVDENLIKAIIWQESKGNINIANGAAGEVGLMQILPPTAREVMGRQITDDELRRPEINIDIGTRYIKQQLTKYGNEEFAIAAYNDGPGDVDKYVCPRNTFDSCTGVNIITRSYVPNVIAYKNDLAGISGEERFILTGKTEKLDGIDVRLVRVDLKKLALFTVLPGTGAPLYSESRFSVHIPIEKRAIELTPKRIDKELNKTQERIEKLDSTIARLEDLVKRWKALCLAVFAYLTLKNSFFSGLSRSQAREQVMNEDPVKKDGQLITRPDGSKYYGWKEYCADPNVLKENNYGSFDQCMFDNADDINGAVDKAKDTIDAVNNQLRGIDDITKQEDQAEIARLHGMNQDQVNVLVKYNRMNSDDVRRLTYLKESQDPAYQQELKNFLGNATQLIDVQKIANERMKISDYNSLSGTQKEEWEKIFLSVLNKPETTAITEGSDVSYLKETYSNANFNDVKRIQIAYPKQDGSYYTYDNNGNEIILEQAKRGTQPIVINGEQVFAHKGQTTQLYLVQGTNELRNSYSVIRPSIEYNEDFTPYKIPIRNQACTGGAADYIEIEYQNGQPIRYNIWNVGPNGKMDYRENNRREIFDDVLHFDDARIRGNQRLLNCVTTSYNAAIGRYKPGARVNNVLGQDYIASFAAARLKNEINKPRCTDVMDPNDCRILFNVCDPVMCPVSRFNLGGRWQLAPGQSVAETGIIGSLILGLPNWPNENTIPPVCVTGVLAGLKNLRSVLQGYEQCLLTAKVRDQSVGICDRIRSVFACEILWREAIAIFKVHGSLVGLVSKALGEADGGGEYLTFESSVDNAANSVEFFTREYASTAFAAYQSRSTEEIGTEICKAAIFGEFPGIGSVVDELTRPENPPQFTAVLSTMPWSETARESRYNVFYHIYAGTDVVGLARGPLRYSVFLRDPSGINRIPFYVTERCNGVRGSIPREGFASHSVDCRGPNGYTEVCVDINGRTECGFGKVSSSYALNYVNDLIVANEVRKEIKTAEECRPDDPRYSTSLGGLIAGNPGILNSGIQRFCSVQNPGSGTNPNDWKPIGDCGKDKDGRYLGSCWIDARSVSIKDTDLLGNVSRELDLRGFNFERGEDVRQELDAALQKNREKNIIVNSDGSITENDKEITDKAELNVLLEEYRLLTEHFDDNVAANAWFMMGMIYLKLDDGIIEPTTRQDREEQRITETGRTSTTTATSTTIAQENLFAAQENCKLKDAYWERNQARDGQDVGLIIRGENCDGLEFKITIYEEDIIGFETIATPIATMRNNEIRYMWKAEWRPDTYGFTDPDFLFDVTYSNPANLLEDILLIRSRNTLTVVE